MTAATVTKSVDRQAAETARLRADLNRLAAEREALDVAVQGLRDMQGQYADQPVCAHITALLSKIGNTREVGK